MPEKEIILPITDTANFCASFFSDMNLKHKTMIVKSFPLKGQIASLEFPQGDFIKNMTASFYPHLKIKFL